MPIQICSAVTRLVEIEHCKYGESFWDGNEIKVIYVCFFLEGQTS